MKKALLFEKILFVEGKKFKKNIFSPYNFLSREKIPK